MNLRPLWVLSVSALSLLAGAAARGDEPPVPMPPPPAPDAPRPPPTPVPPAVPRPPAPPDSPDLREALRLLEQAIEGAEAAGRNDEAERLRAVLKHLRAARKKSAAFTTYTNVRRGREPLVVEPGGGVVILDEPAGKQRIDVAIREFEEAARLGDVVRAEELQAEVKRVEAEVAAATERLKAFTTRTKMPEFRLDTGESAVLRAFFVEGQGGERFALAARASDERRRLESLDQAARLLREAGLADRAAALDPERKRLRDEIAAQEQQVQAQRGFLRRAPGEGPRDGQAVARALEAVRGEIQALRHEVRDLRAIVERSLHGGGPGQGGPGQGVGGGAGPGQGPRYVGPDGGSRRGPGPGPRPVGPDGGPRPGEMPPPPGGPGGGR